MDMIKTTHKNTLAYYEMGMFLREHIGEETIIVCIGTDRCIGDCLGPLVGSFLQNRHFPLKVYGTLEEPVHALNIKKKLGFIREKHPNAHIIGIDACLGYSEDVGEIRVRDTPVYPGKAVGKNLPEVGDMSIIGIVESNESDEIFCGNNVRLSFIFKMANVIVDSLLYAYMKIEKECV